MWRIINIPSFLVFIAITLLFSWLANTMIGMSYWIAGVIIAISILINGIVIILEKNDSDTNK